MITGTVDIKGGVTLNEEDKNCNTQGRRVPPRHMDYYEGIRKTREKCNSADISPSESEHEDEDGKNDNEQICEGPSPGRKNRGKRTVK